MRSNLGRWKIGMTIRVDHDAYLRLVDRERCQIDPLLKNRDDLQANMNAVCTEQGWISRRLGSVQDKRGHACRELIPVVGKTADLDAATGGLLGNGHNFC